MPRIEVATIASSRLRSLAGGEVACCAHLRLNHTDAQTARRRPPRRRAGVASPRPPRLEKRHGSRCAVLIRCLDNKEQLSNIHEKKIHQRMQKRNVAPPLNFIFLPSLLICVWVQLGLQWRCSMYMNEID